MGDSSHALIPVPEDRRREAAAALLEHVPLAVALLDADRRIALANPALVALFGEPVGRRCHEVFRGQAAPCAECGLPALLDGSAEREVFEVQGRRLDGAAISCQLRAHPLRGATGQADLVLAILADVTAQREQRQELQQAERLAGVGLTVASLAHTIKNMLAGLEGGSYLVDSGIARADLERVQGGWSMVQKYVEQVSTLVKNLLGYARAREPVLKLVEPEAFLREVTGLLDEQTRRAGIELAVEVAPGTPGIHLDPDLIQACLHNLVANAIDACTWDPDLDKAHHIVLAARPRPGGGVIFEVSDNGPGIAEEDQARIMKSVFTTKGIRGTGLGLLLSRKAVQEHGGTMTFESRPSQGATFRVALPHAPTAPAPGAASAA